VEKKCIKVGELIVDKSQGTIMLVVGERTTEAKNRIFGDKEYEVYWTKSKSKSWVSEVVLLLIKEVGIKKAVTLVGTLFTSGEDDGF